MARTKVQKQTNMQTIQGNLGLGWLVWWSLPKEWNSDSAHVADLARKAGLPDDLVSMFSAPRDEDSAWRRAASISRLPSAPLFPEEDKCQITLATKVVPGRPDTRILTREIRDGENVRIGMQQLATIVRHSKGIQTVPEPGIPAELETQVQAITDRIIGKYNALAHRVDAARLRTALLTWLRHQGRITLRKAGGVYMIPLPADSSQVAKVGDEVSAVARFISSLDNASMTVIYITNEGGTTVDQLVQAAIAELEEELREVEGRLRSYRQNPRMNAGSRAFSASEMINRVSAVKDRIQQLAYLGSEILVLEKAADLVAEKASALERESYAEVQRATAARKAKKEAARKAKVKKETPKRVKTTGKKTGTARSRKRTLK